MGVIKRFLILSYTGLCFVAAVAALFYCFHQNSLSYQTLMESQLSKSMSAATEDKQ